MADYALDFDGVDDYVDWGNILGFERTDAFSILAWIKTTQSGAEGSVVMKQSGAAGYGMFFLTTGKLRCFLNHSWGANCLSERYDTAINDGNWHLVGFTYDGSSGAAGLKLYVDGEEVTTVIEYDTLSESILNDVDFRIGTRGDSALDYDGIIDEIEVSDIVRSATYISDHWNNGSGVPFEVDGNTVALWHLNEGTNSTVYDETNNNYDGAITGATWVAGYPFLPIEKTSSDTGSGAESLGSRLFGAAETGAGISASWLLAALIGTEETGLGSEFAAKILSALDSGSGTEAHIARLLAAAEIGSAIEAALLVKHLLASDYGLGGDAIATLLALIIGSEVGSGSERFEAKIVTFPGVFDMRLPTSAGEVRIPSKGVNL